MHRAWRSSILVLACACSSDAPAPVPPPLVTAPLDAAADGTSGAGPLRPGLRPDEAPFVAPSKQKRPGRPIDIILRSTPSGAKVAVDGVLIGTTPTIWQGETGAEHEFTFVLEGHALARYRFLPVASGLMHPRLEPVVVVPNAPRPSPELIMPNSTPPSSIVEPAPPLVGPSVDAVVEPATPPAPATPAAPTVDASAPASPF